MPLISVIVTSYNKGKYIEKSLSSILDNSFKDIELIIVEDGSTDNSKSIIRNIIEEHYSRDIFLIENSTNLGAGMSRRIGIEKAKGKWISLIDADDWIDSDYYDKLIDASEKSNADIIYSRIKYCYGDSIQDDVAHCNEEVIVNDPQQIFRNFSWYGLQYLNYSLTKKELYDKIGGYCPARFIEDTPTAVKLLSVAKKIHIVPYHSYAYRSVENSLMNSHNNVEKAYWLYYNLMDSLNFLEKMNIESGKIAKQNILNDVYTQCSLLRIDETDFMRINKEGWIKIVEYFSIDETICKEKKNMH